MKDKRIKFFEYMEALEFSVYFMKHWDMKKEAELLYYNMVAELMGAFANDEITSLEFMIFDDYLNDVYNELFN